MTTTTTEAPSGASGRSKRATTNGKVKTVTVRGVKFAMPVSVEARLLKHIEEDDTIAFLELVLGDQMEKFWSIDLPLPLRKSLEELVTEAFTKITEATGLTPGE